MNGILAAALFAGIVSTVLLSQVANAVGAVLCADVLARLRIVENESRARSVEELVRIGSLEQHGIEECRDHEEYQADEFFLQALQTIVK